MAVYNEILAGRFNRFVQKLLSIKGPVSLVAASPDLVFQHPVFHGAENRYLEGWDSFGVAATTSAVAAQLSELSFRNPVNSGIGAVVIRLATSDPTAGTSAGFSTQVNLVRNMTTDQNQALANLPFNFDMRGRPSPTCVITKNTGAPTAPGGSQVLIAGDIGTAANTVVEHIPTGLEIPIMPGSGLLLVGGAVNTPLITIVWWRERPLEESERF